MGVLEVKPFPFLEPAVVIARSAVRHDVAIPLGGWEIARGQDRTHSGAPLQGHEGIDSSRQGLAPRNDNGSMCREKPSACKHGNMQSLVPLQKPISPFSASLGDALAKRFNLRLVCGRRILYAVLSV